MKIKVVIALAILVLLAVLMIQNAGPVDFHFLFWTVLVSRFIVLPVAFLLGFAFGYLIAMARRPRLTKAS